MSACELGRAGPTWRTLLGDYPNTRALRSGAVAPSVATLAFEAVATPNKAFKRVVRTLEFDVAELALMTFLMARSRDVALRLLPVTVFSRNPLPYLVCRADDRLSAPDLATRCIAVRAYTTTTAVWVRTLLKDLYDVDFTNTRWTTIEEGHVAGVAEPPTVRRAESNANLVAMLLDGVIDAAIVDPVPADPRIAPVVTDAERACAEWQAHSGARTLNHVVVVGEALAHDRDAMSDLFACFQKGRAAAGADLDLASVPIGFEAHRRHLEVAIAAASSEGLLARPLTPDDLVTSTLAALV